MAVLDTFIALRNYAKGKIGKNELLSEVREFDNIIENHTNKGLSEVIVEFNDSDDFLKLMGLHDDNIWFYNIINSPYSSYEFYDSSTVRYDFEEGYGVFSELNDENHEKLNEISSIIMGRPINWGDEKMVKSFAEKLLYYFPNEIENIIDDYATETNHEMSQSASEHINGEVDLVLNDLGFKMYGNGFKTTIGNLIMLYIKHNIIHLDFYDFLEKIFEEYSDSFSNWADDIFEYRNDKYFDSNSFNYYSGGILDDILERIKKVEGFSGVTHEDYRKMVDRITKKFKINKYYFLPKDTTNETRFSIQGFEFPEMKVIVELQKGFKRKDVKLSEENFYNLLYIPSLFNLSEV